jgi:hypothetical protein
MPKMKTFISDIIGGEARTARDIGDPITSQHIWDAYRLTPGFKEIHKLAVKARWSNGLNEDTILPDRLLELKDADEWNDVYGHSIVIVDATKTPPTCEAWHLRLNGIGYAFSDFSPMGNPLEVEIMTKPLETTQGRKPIKIPAYPCEVDSRGERIKTRPIPGQYGFFNLRTRGSIKGVQGLPKNLSLVDPMNGQYDILKAYLPYAEKQGLAHPTAYLKDPSPTNRAQVKADFKEQPQKDRLVILSMEDALEYQSPQQNAWDPWPILDWVNRMIARASQMHKLMLEGDPGGMISTSETAISNWEADIKEEQVYLRTQMLPIWIALGATDECNFKDPSKPTFISLMEGIKAIREGMDGIVAKEDMVRLMNERLELEGEDELTVAEDEELENNMLQEAEVEQ